MYEGGQLDGRHLAKVEDSNESELDDGASSFKEEQTNQNIQNLDLIENEVEEVVQEENQEQIEVLEIMQDDVEDKDGNTKRSKKPS